MSTLLRPRFGPAQVEIEVADELPGIAEALGAWLGTDTGGDGGAPDLRFRLAGGSGGARGARPEVALEAGDAWLGESGFGWWDGRGWETVVSRHREGFGQLLWTSRVRDGRVLSAARRMPPPLLRLAHHHYFSYPEMLASTFLYRHLLPAVQLALLERGATLVHASSLLRGPGEGVLISGWGGSGKTSASSYLYLERPERWRFMSDDLAVLDREGTLHASPLPLNVFPYNTRQFPRLAEQTLAGMGRLERAHWRVRAGLLGPDGVVRRVRAPDATPGLRGTLRLAVHLVRSTGGPPRLERCEPAGLAMAGKAILGHELRHGLAMLASANAFGSGEPGALPAPDELLRDTEGVLRAAFSEAQLFRMHVPVGRRAVELADAVEDLLDQVIAEGG